MSLVWSLFPTKSQTWWLLPFLVFPWLNTYTAGPTPNTWPWLVSAACATLLCWWRDKINGELVALTWLLAASLSALIGVIQYFGWAHALYPWISQTGLGEAFANLRQRNQFATLTSIGLVALIALRAQQLTLQPKLSGLILLVLLALGNAASGSRTGLLQWLLIPTLSAWWFWPKQREALVFSLQALLAYGVAVLSLPWLLEWMTGTHSNGLFGRLVESTGCSSRKILWSNVLTLISQKPWLGWGWGELDYAHFITLYPGERFCEILDNAHNLPLHLAVELGIPAALTICGMFTWLVWKGKPWDEIDPIRQMAWGVLAVIGLHSLLEYPLWYGPFQMATGLSIFLLYTRKKNHRMNIVNLVNLVNLVSKDKNNGLLFLFKPALFALLSRLMLAVVVAILVGTALRYQQVSQIYLTPAERNPAYRDDTLNKIRGNGPFQAEARFAELSMTPLTLNNAVEINTMAKELLHYSPEPRVIEQVIESAVMLRRENEGLEYLVRYQAAFPQEHARWAKDKK